MSKIRKTKCKPGPKPKVQRDQEIVALRTWGATFASIGRSFGITRQRVEQICSKDQRRQARIRGLGREKGGLTNIEGVVLAVMAHPGKSVGEHLGRLGLDKRKHPAVYQAFYRAADHGVIDVAPRTPALVYYP